MSHITTYQSDVLKNCKKGLLVRAAKDLGLKLDYSIKSIKNTWIHDVVDAGFVKDDKAIALGIKLHKEGRNTRVEVSGDFYGTGIEESSFIDKLSQAYKKHDVIYQCKKQGWTVNAEDIKIDKNTNDIIISATRYVA